MRNNPETLRMRVSRLEKLVAECPSPGVNVPEEVKHILKTAPKLLKDLEESIRSKDQRVLDQIHAVMQQAEAYLEFAVGTVKGEVTAEAIRSGMEADPSLPTDQRLTNRMTKFLATKITTPLFLSLVREFSGEDAVVGEAVFMDPVGEMESFSQWMMHDIKLPGESRRLIDLFAEKEMATIPADERSVLVARLRDRPSIYKVIELQAKDRPSVYRVQDLLSPEVSIWISDKSTSKTLGQGAVFVGRAIPGDDEDRRYCLLGSVTELPPKLWSMLSESLDEWSKEYFAKRPEATAQDFFRDHHAKLNRWMLEITK